MVRNSVEMMVAIVVVGVGGAGSWLSNHMFFVNTLIAHTDLQTKRPTHAHRPTVHMHLLTHRPTFI